MAVAAVDFARAEPEDARLMLTIRLGDLLDAQPGDTFAETLAAMNAPLRERITGLVRSHAHDDPPPSWLSGDVAVGVRALLTSHLSVRR